MEIKVHSKAILRKAIIPLQAIYCVHEIVLYWDYHWVLMTPSLSNRKKCHIRYSKIQWVLIIIKMWTVWLKFEFGSVNAWISFDDAERIQLGRYVQTRRIPRRRTPTRDACRFERLCSILDIEITFPGRGWGFNLFGVSWNCWQMNSRHPVWVEVL